MCGLSGVEKEVIISGTANFQQALLAHIRGSPDPEGTVQRSAHSCGSPVRCRSPWGCRAVPIPMGGGGAGPASPARLPNAWHPHRAPIRCSAGGSDRGVQRPCVESASLLPSAEIDPIFFFFKSSNLTRPCRPSRRPPHPSGSTLSAGRGRGPIYLAGVCRLRYARARAAARPEIPRRRRGRSWAAPNPAAGPEDPNPGRGGREGG